MAKSLGMESTSNAILYRVRNAMPFSPRERAEASSFDLAKAALAALGLDDLDAFVEHAWGHYSHPGEDEPESAEIEAMRCAVVAAFNRSATDSTGASDA